MNLLKFHSKSLVIIVFLWLLTGRGQILQAKSEKRYEVSLYTGIPEVARLGESYRSLTKNIKIPFTPIDVTKDPMLLQSGIVSGIDFESIGAKVYFKQGISCLIMLQPPFKGVIKTKQVQLFDTPKPSTMNWKELIIKELGQPTTQGTGSILGGDVYYYPWGDIEISRIGLRQLMLYRDRSILEYRQALKTNVIKLFK